MNISSRQTERIKAILAGLSVLTGGLVMALSILLINQKPSLENRSQAAPPQEHIGKLKVRISEEFETETANVDYYLTTTDNQDYKLESKSGKVNAPAGAKIKVKGQKSGKNIILEEQSSENPELLAVESTAVPATRPVKTAVFLINFQNDTSQPAAPESVRNLVFGNTPNTVTLRNYTMENTFNQQELLGALNPTGDVFGWYTIPYDNTSCSQNYWTWGITAETQAQAQGYIASNYDKIVYLFNRADGCPGTGWAYVNMQYAWLQNIFGRADFAGLIAHELGHSSGSFHANGYYCKDDATLSNWVPISNNCYTGQRNDSFDLMGYGYTGNHHMSNESKRGTLSRANIDRTIISQNTTIEIYPTETDAERPLFFIDRGSAVSDLCFRYFVPEYRQISFFDNYNSADPVVNGITLRLAADDYPDNGGMSYPQCTNNTGETFLVNTHASGSTTVGQNQFRDAPLLRGETFVDPISDVRFTVVSADSIKAVVQLEFGPGYVAPALPSPTAAPTQVVTPTPVLTATPTPKPSITPVPGDTIAPKVTIKSPRNGTTIKDTSKVNISVTATDNSSKISSIEIWLGSSLLKTCPDTTKCSTSTTGKALVIGSNVIQAFALDHAGNRGVAQVTVIKK